MGVNCRIILPDNVQLGNVTNVIGVLCGLKPKKRYFSPSEGWATCVPGATYKPCDSLIAECAVIIIKAPLLPHIQEYRNAPPTPYVRYHFEPERGGRLLMPPSTNFWVAIGKRLVQFFGGYIDYNDCDDVEMNFSRRKKPRYINSPVDGRAWYKFQNRLLKLKPLTRNELVTAFEPNRIIS